MLADKTILITGATSGIGRAICHDLIESGAGIVAIGRNDTALAELVALAPDRVRTLAFDLTDFPRYSEVIPALGPFDGVVCSAGIIDNNPLRFFSLERYQRVVDINQTAPLALIAELARSSQLNPSCSIVLMSSVGGTKIGTKGAAAYAATKAALTAYAKVMAVEFAHKLIRVNTVCPGMVNTDFVINLQHASRESLALDMQRYPLGKRYAEPSEIAKAVRFLLSDLSTFITGTDLVVDGGFSIQ